jgi:hypothetical protein
MNTEETKSCLEADELRSGALGRYVPYRNLVAGGIYGFNRLYSTTAMADWKKCGATDGMGVRSCLRTSMSPMTIKDGEYVFDDMGASADMALQYLLYNGEQMGVATNATYGLRTWMALIWPADRRRAGALVP